MNYQVLFGKTIELFFISVPEQIYLVLFVLILANRYDCICPLTVNAVKKITFAALIPASVSILLRTLGGFDINLMPFIGVFVFTITFSFVYSIVGFKQVIKIFVFVVVGFITVMIIQLLFVPLLLYGTSITMEDLNKPNLITLLWTLPERTVEAIVLSVLLIRRINVNNIKVMKLIFRNRFFTIVFLFLVALNLFIVYTFSIIVYIDKVIVNLKPLSQISIITCVITFILFNMSVFFISAYYVADRKKNEQTFIIQEAQVLKALIVLRIREGKYQEINSILEDFNILLKDTSKYMYRKGLKI